VWPVLINPTQVTLDPSHGSGEILRDQDAGSVVLIQLEQKRIRDVYPSSLC